MMWAEGLRYPADTPASNKSTIAQGGEGFWEYEAKRKAAEAESGKSGDGQAVTPRNSAQDAERVKGWEKSTGNGTAGVDADKLLDNLPKDEAQTQQWFDAFGRIDQSALTPVQQRRLYDAASEVYGQPGPAGRAFIGGMRGLTRQIDGRRKAWGIKDPEPKWEGSRGYIGTRS